MCAAVLNKQTWVNWKNNELFLKRFTSDARSNIPSKNRNHKYRLDATIFVDNIVTDSSDCVKDLDDIFTQFGDVEYIKVQAVRGYAWISFFNPIDATKAISSLKNFPFTINLLINIIDEWFNKYNCFSNRSKSKQNKHVNVIWNAAKDELNKYDIPVTSKRSLFMSHLKSRLKVHGRKWYSDGMFPFFIDKRSPAEKLLAKNLPKVTPMNEYCVKQKINNTVDLLDGSDDPETMSKLSQKPSTAAEVHCSGDPNDVHLDDTAKLPAIRPYTTIGSKGSFINNDNNSNNSNSKLAMPSVHGKTTGVALFGVPKFALIRMTNTFIDASVKCNVNLVKEYLNNGQNPNGLHSVLGYSALHGASLSGSVDVITELLLANASINIRRMETGETPLHFAAMGKKRYAERVIRRLLNAGADKSVQTIYGLKPADVALDCGLDDHIFVILCQDPDQIVTAKCSEASSHSVTLCFKEPRSHGIPLQQLEIRWRILRDNPRKTPRKELTDLLEWGAQRNKAGFASSSVTTYDSTHNSTIHERNHQRHWESLNRVYPHDSNNNNSSKLLTITSGPLYPATEYEFNVRCHSDAGAGKWSIPAIKVSTMASVPDAPHKPTMIGTGATNLTVQWEPPMRDNGHHIASYQLQIRQEKNIKDNCQPNTNNHTNNISNFTNADSNNDNSSVSSDSYRYEWQTVSSVIYNSYTVVRNLIPSTRYRFRVRASNIIGSGSYSSKSAVILTNPTIFAMSRRPTSLEISWGNDDTNNDNNDSNSNKTYEIQLKEAKRTAYGDSWEKCSWRTITRECRRSNSYVIRRLTPDHGYVMRVRDLTPLGWADWEDSAISPVIRTLCCEPGEVRDVRLINIMHNTMVLAWSLPSTNGSYVDVYQVEKQTPLAQDSDWTVIRENVTQTTFTALNLLSNTNYRFRVRAHNKYGWGSFSEPSSLDRTKAIPPPSAPQLLSKDDSLLSVKWTYPSSRSNGAGAGTTVLSYELQYCLEDDNGVSSEYRSTRLSNRKTIKESYPEPSMWTIVSNEIHSTSYLVNDLDPVRPYKFRVRALCERGYSGYSDKSEAFVTSRRY